MKVKELQEDTKNKKGDFMQKRVLIAINNLVSNSIGISLVNLLNSVDYTQYKIDLIFRNSQSNLLNQISSKVNIIHSPYKGKLKFMDKVKLFHKYNFSLMYDIGDESLSDLVRIASKNNAIYIHHNYKNIYVVPKTYDEFILKAKILDFKKILFPNENIKEAFNDNFPQTNNNSYVLKYIVDDKRITMQSKVHVEADKPNYCTLLVAAGSLNDRSKNYTLMIKMMKGLIQKNNKVHLWILGDGPDLVSIKMLVNQMGLNEYVTLFGFKNNPYPYMAMADYILNTSDNDDSSTTLIEARVLEKPIISTFDDEKNENSYKVSSDPEKIADEVNNIILKRIKYIGTNNFWVENQHVFKTLENIVNSK